MKRSNRLILLIGIFLAIVAFIGIVLIFQNNNNSNTGGTGNTAAPTQLPTVYAKVDIPFGTAVTADMVETQQKATTERAADAFADVGLVVGKIATTNIVAGKQLEASDFALSRTGQAPVAPNLAAGMRAVDVLVDQVTGVGTLINVGDHVDVIAAFDKSNWINPQPVPVPNPPAAAPESGGNATSVKVLIQGLVVVGTLLPPPAATTQNGQQPAASAAPETALNGQQEIVILQATPQQAEIIRFAQLDGTIALALRSPKDFVDANGKPVVPPVDKTTGIVLKTLIDQYGVLPPELQPLTVKGQR